MRWECAISTSEHRPALARATLGCLCLLVLLLASARVWPQSSDALPEPMIEKLIVKFRSQPAASVEPERARVSRLAADRRVPLAYVRPMALGAHVVALDHPVPLSEAHAIAQRLAGQADVEYVQPDRRMRAALLPNDPDLNLQTYLRDDAAGISAFSTSRTKATRFSRPGTRSTTTAHRCGWSRL